MFRRFLFLNEVYVWFLGIIFKECVYVACVYVCVLQGIHLNETFTDIIDAMLLIE